MRPILRTLLPLAVVALLSLPAQAAVYYVSPTGNDANAGTSSTAPWKTITRVNQLSFGLQPGDQVLFQRGGTYRGTIVVASNGTVTNPITIGAYGTGAMPIISGSQLLSNWVVHQGNIWKVQVAGSVRTLFSNGQLMTLARYPNSGWLRNDNGTSTRINDDALTQAAGYWNGAQVVIRGSNWSYDISQITSSIPGQINFTDMYMPLDTMKWGYFLRNKLSELDTPGEWFHDPASGWLYFRAPGDVNPNTLTVEASNTDRGAWVYMNWQYIVFDGLMFKHQAERAVFVDAANHVTVRNCTFEDLGMAIFSYGSYNLFQNNTFNRTYQTAISLIDNNTVVENSTFSNIAMVPGLGETNWGYMGIRVQGNNNIVRNNHLETVGYIGISVHGNTTVERNFVKNALALLNDGCGIGMENADGVVVRENIILDIQGNLESAAYNSPSYWQAGMGIYFGNVSVKNTLVQYNTMANCKGAGIHVDHTMVSTGNQIKDNVMFNNNLQLSISDYSNYNGPGATPPYFVPSFNTVYSGNIMYSLTKDQLCMKQMHCYSSTMVDFGSFLNNRYFNPYNEMNIQQFNVYGSFIRNYALDRWQSVTGDDAGSAIHPQRLNAHATVAELSTNLLSNGTFDANTSGWGGTPNNGILTRELTYLDNGSMKSYLNNSNIYPEFTVRNATAFTTTNGQWYRMRFSVQSNILGEVKAGVKGNTQMTGPQAIFERSYPFSTTRRDVEVYFQSNLTDNSFAQFTNHYSTPQYWLDNIQLHRVSVQPLDPTVDHILVYNDLSTVQTKSLPSGNWSDVNGTVYTGSITVQPFRSVPLYRTTATVTPVGYSVGSKVFLHGALIAGTSTMRDNLRANGVLPSSEPYTALGLPVANTGATMATGLNTQTGSTALVDWVLVELRNNDATFSLAERRAALVRVNGDVINPDGSALVTFNTDPVNKRLVIRHRNHLAAMSATSLTTNGQVMDFTSPSTPFFGSGAVWSDGVRNALWCGDVNTDGVVRYTGASNDRDPILAAIGGTVPTNTISGYRREDVNLDGMVRYTGAANDRDLVLSTIGGTVPTNTKVSTAP
ncbi:MAG: right-handed parallel beta-helix repeat-containing protein [Flavobacteriales bacterium]|nr:right-handed parallel beta-helix repeat-containing protein [Flavobacteriales bacterium]